MHTNLENEIQNRNKKKMKLNGKYSLIIASKDLINRNKKQHSFCKIMRILFIYFLKLSEKWDFVIFFLAWNTPTYTHKHALFLFSLQTE